jgi:hypothetical protein
MLPLLLRRESSSGKAGGSRSVALIWLGFGLFAAAAYFIGIEHNSANPTYAYGHQGVPPTMSTFHMLAQDPWHSSRKLLIFAFGMFGNSLGRGYHFPDNIVVCRVIGGVVAAATILLVVLGLRRIRQKRIVREPILFWSGLSMAAFCFVAAAFVAVGRTFRGYTQPLTPRYTTYGTFCVLALVLLAAGFFTELIAELPDTQMKSGETKRSTHGNTLAVVLATLAVCLQIGPWTYGWQFMEGWSHARWTSLAALRFARTFDFPHLSGRAGVPDELLFPCLDTLDRIGRPIVEKHTDRALTGFKFKDSGHPVEHSTAEFRGVTAAGKLAFGGRATLYKNHPGDLVVVSAESPGETPHIIDATFSRTHLPSTRCIARAKTTSSSTSRFLQSTRLAHGTRKSVRRIWHHSPMERFASGFSTKAATACTASRIPSIQNHCFDKARRQHAHPEHHQPWKHLVSQLLSLFTTRLNPFLTCSTNSIGHARISQDPSNGYSSTMGAPIKRRTR